MTAVSRKTLTAALALGAAVFAWPVQALQCPRQLFWRASMPVDEAFDRMHQFAAKKVTEAQSIFKGRIIKVEYIGPDDEYPVLVLTYEVDEWLKGNGRRHAKIIYEGWCDGPCDNIVRMMDSLKYDQKEQIYIADRPASSGQKTNPNIPSDTDGIFGLCARLGRTFDAINQARIGSSSHRDFLFEIAMTNQIENLPAKPH